MTSLLLIEDIEKVGRKGDIVKVKPGFARNYLIPQNFAVIADKRAIRMQARLQEERLKKAEEDRKESEALAKRLEPIVVSVTVKVDTEGNMYGSVSSLDLIHLMNEQHSIVLDKKSFVMKHPIKQTGSHPIELKLSEGVEAKFTLEVSPETAEI